jgi:hypothetical protein
MVKTFIIKLTNYINHWSKPRNVRYVSVMMLFMLDALKSIWNKNQDWHILETIVTPHLFNDDTSIVNCLFILTQHISHWWRLFPLLVNVRLLFITRDVKYSAFQTAQSFRLFEIIVLLLATADKLRLYNNW